jgi:hypothetical protein
MVITKEQILISNDPVPSFTSSFLDSLKYFVDVKIRKAIVRASKPDRTP